MQNIFNIISHLQERVKNWLKDPRMLRNRRHISSSKRFQLFNPTGNLPCESTYRHKQLLQDKKTLNKFTQSHIQRYRPGDQRGR